MKVLQQKNKFKIENWGGGMMVVNGNTDRCYRTLFGVWCGPPNCGKSNVVFNMFDANGLFSERASIFQIIVSTQMPYVERYNKITFGNRILYVQ